MYARIIEGRVAEVIPPFVRTEAMRPPHPGDLPEDATDEARALHAEALAYHDNFQVGPVPIEERYHPDVVAQLVPAPNNVALGDLFTDGQWSAAPPLEALPPAVPRLVTMRQARLALLAAGHLQAVEDAIDALQPAQRAAARIEWDYATTVERAAPLVAFLASELDLSEAEVDEMFIEAGAL